MTKQILVTGGAGFIGSHICDVLLAAGYAVDVLDDYSAEAFLVPNGVRQIFPTNLAMVAATGAQHIAYDCIVHAAARADVASNWVSRAERDRLELSNVTGTRELCEAFPGVPIVMLSTCAVYGDSTTGDEGEACIATSPYAASKLAGEAIVQAHAFARGTPWHIFRLGCVVGARYHHGHIADFVRMAQDAEDGCVIRARSNGQGVKSFVHVRDVADVVAGAVDGECDSGVYNLAKTTWTPSNTVDVMAMLAGRPVSVEWRAGAVHGWIGDPMACVSAAKIQAAGFDFDYDISDGVREALASLGWPE